MTQPASVARPARSTRSTRPAHTIAEEHRVLRVLRAEIEAVFRGKTLRRESGLDVVAVRLDTLRGPLCAHFDEEERAGFFEKVEELAPEQAPACERLRREHQGLLVRLDALRDATPEARRGPEWARGVRAFLDELGDHEARETELLMRSLEDPGGAPD